MHQPEIQQNTHQVVQIKAIRSRYSAMIQFVLTPSLSDSGNKELTLALRHQFTIDDTIATCKVCSSVRGCYTLLGRVAVTETVTYHRMLHIAFRVTRIEMDKGHCGSTLDPVTHTVV